MSLRAIAARWSWSGRSRGGRGSLARHEPPRLTASVGPYGKASNSASLSFALAARVRVVNQGVGQPVVNEGRGYARLCEVVQPGDSLDLLRREEQRVGQVVHQDGDPDGVDGRERDRDHGEGCQRPDSRSAWSPCPVGGLGDANPSARTPALTPAETTRPLRHDEFRDRARSISSKGRSPRRGREIDQRGGLT